MCARQQSATDQTAAKQAQLSVEAPLHSLIFHMPHARRSLSHTTTTPVNARAHTHTHTHAHTCAHARVPTAPSLTRAPLHGCRFCATQIASHRQGFHRARESFTPCGAGSAWSASGRNAARARRATTRRCLARQNGTRSASSSPAWTALPCRSACGWSRPLLASPLSARAHNRRMPRASMRARTSCCMRGLRG